MPISSSKVSNDGLKLKDGYELSRQAFKDVHGRSAMSTTKDSAWIRGWQSGFAAAIKHYHIDLSGKPK